VTFRGQGENAPLAIEWKFSSRNHSRHMTCQVALSDETSMMMKRSEILGPKTSRG